MPNITKNLSQLRKEISHLAQLSKRRPADVHLIAVSKTQTIDAIQQAYRAGQVDFAENYLQEAETKIAQAKSLGHAIQWHFIGQIQSNKCTRIADNFDWVHSLASLKHARRLDEARAQASTSLKVCVQVSLQKNTGRSGLALSELSDFVHAIRRMSNLQLRGLMCVLPTDYTGEQAYSGFMQVKNAFDALKKNMPDIDPVMDTLSMGMSADYPQAIRAGATMLRLGTAIFGARAPAVHSTEVKKQP